MKMEKENELKALMNDLKNLLNNSYEENKKNPNNYKYLSSLTSSIEKIEELNNFLKDINS